MKAIGLYIICLGSFVFLPESFVFANPNYVVDLQIALMDSLPDQASDITKSYLQAGQVAKPWTDISITDGHMKPFYPPVIVAGSPFPFIPVLAGVAGAGVITYLLVKPDKEDTDCNFNASVQFGFALCDQPTGWISLDILPETEYTYLWSNGSTSRDINNLLPGTYTCTITQTGTSCMDVVNATVSNVDELIIVTLNSEDADCGQANGTVTASVTPAGTYTFLWSDGSTSSNLTDLSQGTYTVTVTSEGKCEAVSSTTIEENIPNFTVSVSSIPTTCGETDGTAAVQVNPPGIYLFQWSNGEMGELISDIGPGMYSVTVTVPGSSCSVSGTVTVDEGPPEFEVTSETFPSDCGLSTGVAQLTVVPDGAYTFQWSNGGSSAEQNDLAAGTYQVTVTIDGTSCSKEVSVTIDELPPTMMLTFNSTPAGCGVSNGSASVTVNPAGAYDYIWSNGNIGSALIDVPSGEYMVTVSIAGTTCSVIGMVEVGQTGGGFTGIFTTEKADCGLDNGSATISVDPPGEYTYLWSNQQSDITLTNVEAGTYSVTVTDENACTEVFTVTIGENPAEYVTINSTSPSNCVESGEITFTLTTPGAGPLTLLVEGPLGIEMYSLAPGVHLLSSLINVVAGEYMLTVYDESIGPECQDVGSAIVIDNTPDLEAVDDFFTIPAGEVLLANALTNDLGLMIEMTDAFSEFGGTVTFDEFGDFVFTPDPGFFGEASFFYTITDACGMMQMAVVTITVEMVDCMFDAFFETIPASCGLEDGSISVEVSEPGVYTYEWSNGDSGPSLTDVEAGTYSVTIMDVNLGCELVFTENIDALPADYISDVIITQPTCGGTGEIQFTAFTTSQNPLIMSVTHPNGSDIFFINPGVIMLSDYVSITSGDYAIEVTDAGAGPDCFESFEATIEPSAQVEIFVEGVFPPTEPTSMDGAAIIIISVPGTPPYSVLLNGLLIFETSDPVFTIEGLDIGEYIVQVIDAEGCTSNEVVFFVPFPPITQSFGTSFIFLTPHVSNEQPHQMSTDYLVRTTMLVSVEYYLRAVRHEWRLTFSPPVYAQGISYQPYAELFCFTDLTKYTYKDVWLALQGGLGSAFGSHPVAMRESSAASPLWSLRASAVYAHKRSFKLQGSVSLQGWEEIERPVVELSAMFSIK
jgi:hypothetical protein